MRKVSRKRVARILLVCICMCAAACARADPQPERVQLANPAARKCLDDGYRLDPVRDAGGLPISHDCVDPRNGERCDAWDYFRGQCRLRAAPSPSAPTSDVQ